MAKSAAVIAAEKNNQEKQEAKDTLRREMKDREQKKITPPSELGVVNNLRNAASDAKDAVAKKVREVFNPKVKASVGEPLEVEEKAYGGKVNKMANGGKVKKSSTSRGDGIAQRGKTKGRMV